jgi:hypothetical protein
MYDFHAYDIALVPVIIGLVRTARLMGLPARWQPALALVLGVAAGWFYIAPDEPKRAILAGLVMGLSAIGLWSGVKNSITRKEPGGK